MRSAKIQKRKEWPIELTLWVDGYLPMTHYEDSGELKKTLRWMNMAEGDADWHAYD